ncbi:MAG TPA: OmpA family protein, partial [Acidimicrobiia bacterium]
VNLPGADSCTREGYTLRGFGTDPNGEGQVFAPGAPIQLTGNNRIFAIWTDVASGPEPFLCTPDLIQVSGTGGGVLYVYDPTRNTMDLVPDGGGPDKAPGANATGYNPADDFIYGVAPNGSNRHLWKFGSNGVYEDLGAIIDSGTGAPVQNLNLISGDFIADDLLLAIQRRNRMLTIDVAPTRSGQPAQATLQALPRGVWDAADIAFTSDRTVGYGMSHSSLFIATLPGGDAASQVAAVGQRSTFTRKTVLGVPSKGNYGASYLDQGNNAYFYNNEQRRIYVITAEELQKRQPTAVALGTERAFVLGTDRTLQVPTDGASCPSAPIVTVTLEYRLNGGSGERPAKQSGFVDQEVTVAPGVGFDREGFTFAGWNSAADGSGASYPPGAFYPLGQSDGVLFAQWEPAEPAPIVPPENILDPIEEPKPLPEDGDEVVFTPIDELPTPPDDPWEPSSVVLVDPDTRIETPVVQNDSGDWSVNNRIGTVTYTPEPAYSGPVSMTIQLQTVSGERFQTTLQTTAPTCEVGKRVRATVYFDVLESDLTKKSRRTLNRLVRKANRQGTPTCTVVVGFVQPTPNRSNDSSLSTSRAESVADYLESRGMDRIVRTEGLGRADQQGAKARRATATIYLAPQQDLPLTD